MAVASLAGIGLKRIGLGRKLRSPNYAYRRRYLRLSLEGLEPRMMLASDLLVADGLSDSILRFDGDTGAPLGAFVASGSGGLVDPLDPTFGPDGDLYVISNATGAQKILRFDGTSGASQGTFVDTGAGGFAGGSAIEFGPDGNLYVATNTSSGVLRFDGNTGAFLGNIGAGAVRRAGGLGFGLDNNLYVMDSDGLINTFADRVLRFNPSSGVLIDEFVSPGALDDVSFFSVGPDGDLYVPEFSTADIRRFNGSTGEFQGVFIGGGLTGGVAFDVIFGPDGNAYASNVDGVLRFDGETGAVIDSFISGVTGTATFFSFDGSADLAVSNLSVPIGVVQGTDLSISYTVTNNSANATAVNQWVDVLYLSPDDVFDSSDRELGRIERTTGLMGGASYTETRNAPLPSVPLGDYHVFVFADRRGSVNDPTRLNNLRRSTDTLEVFAQLATSHEPDHSIAVGRTLSAYTTADLTNNELTITYTVYNLTDGYAQGVLLTSTLEAGVDFVTASQFPDRSGRELAWSLGTLSPFDRVSVELTVSLAGAGITNIDSGPQAFATIDTLAVSDQLGAAVLRTNVIEPSLLAATTDANSADPFIQQKAAELDYDPQRIFDVLHNDIGFDSYTGSLRGARGTLWSSAGNALDVASLGVALMRASGIPAQYVSGTLSQAQAQGLIASMFPESFQTVGFIRPGTELVDFINNPELLGETQSHYWFQFDIGGGMRDADPLMAGAVVGQVFTVADDSFVTVPDQLRGKTSVKVTAELFSQGAAALGAGGLSNRVVLNQSFDDVHLVGRTLTIGNFVNTESVGTPTFTAVTNTYSPYFRIDDVANLKLGEDELLRGVDFQEVLTNFPLGTAVLTGLFLEITTTEPQVSGGTSSDTLRKTLFDRIGFEARQGGAAVTVSATPTDLPSIGTFDLYSLWILASSLPESVLIRRQEQLAVLSAEQATRLSDTIANPRSPTQAADLARLNTLTREVVVHSLGAFGDAFLAASAELSTLSQSESRTNIYFDSPRILAVTNATTAQDGSLQARTEMDILRNAARVLSAPGQSVENQEIVHLARGMLDKALEAVVIGGTGEEARTSSLDVFFAALNSQQPLVSITATTLTTLDALPLSGEAKARITQSVLDGHQVVTPAAMVSLSNGASTIAWLQRNLSNGDWILVSEKGGHASTIEYGDVQVAIPDEIVGGQATAFQGIQSGLAQAAKIIPKIKDAKAKLGQGINAGRLLPFSWSISHVTRELDALLPRDPTNLPLTLFRLFFLGAITVASADPPLPNYFRQPFVSPSTNVVTTELAPAANLSPGTVTGDLRGTDVQISGSVITTWTNQSTSRFTTSSLVAAQATVLDSQGNTIGSGLVRLSSDALLPVSITGDLSYTVSGNGTLSAYGRPESFGVSANWDQYTATVTGSAALALTIPAATLSLNQETLPAGAYTITANAVTLSGSGQSSAPSFSESVAINVTDAVVNLHPAGGTIAVDGQPITAEDGFTLGGYSGSLAITASDTNLDSVVLDGTVTNVLTVSGAPRTLTTDGNTPVAFQATVATSFPDSYDLTVEAPRGWAVTVDTDGEISVAVEPGLQTGTHAIRIFAQAKTNPELLAQTAVNVTLTPTTQDAELTVVPDPIFTIPFDGAQVQSAFQAQIRNLSPEADTYVLTFPSLPPGFKILNSVDSVRIPAGETGIIGVYLEPIGSIPAPGSNASFDVRAVSVSDSAITRTVTVPYTVPEIHFVSVFADPSAIALLPGQSRNVDVIFTSVGNVAEEVTVSVAAPAGLSVSGPSVLELHQGEAITVPFTFSATTDISFGSILDTTITAIFADGELGVESDRVLVKIAAPGADAASGAAIAADDLDQPDLSNRLKDLSTALTALTQNPANEILKNQAINSLDSILSLLAVDSLFVDFVDPLLVGRDELAWAFSEADSLAAVTTIGSALDDFAAVTMALARGNFDVFVTPNSQVAQPQTPREFHVMLHNIGTDTSTYNLAVSGLPADVSAVFDNTFVTLDRDEFADVTLTLTQTSTTELLAFNFNVDVSIDGTTPAVTKSASGSLRTRNEVVSVTSVDIAPPFGDAGTEVAISASLLNAVNREQSVTVMYSVSDPQGTEIFSTAANPVGATLNVQTSLLTIDLGTFDTTGLADGQYTVLVTVLDAAGVPIPKATGRGALLVGSPVKASLTVSPQQLPPGTSTITNTLRIDAEIVGGGELLQVLAQVPIDEFNNQVLRDLVFNGDVAYVLANGIHVVDVSSPLAPTVTNFRGNGEGLLLRAEVVGDQLITIETGNGSPIANFVNTGISTWDISGNAGSSATNPLRRDRQTNNYLFGNSLATDGDAAFMSMLLVGQNFGNGDITYQNGTVLSFDISNPADVVPLDVLFNANDRNGALPLFRNGGNNNVFDLLVPTSGTLLVASSTATDTDTQTGVGRILVVDISDPTSINSDAPNPSRIVTTLDIPGTTQVQSFERDGDLLFVQATEGGWLDPFDPLVAEDIGPTGNIVLATVDISNPRSPTLIHSQVLPRAARGAAELTALGNRQFAFSSLGAINDDPQLFVIDASDPTDFQVAAQTTTPSHIEGLEVHRNLLYATSPDGLTVYSLGGGNTPVTAEIQIPNGTAVEIVAGSFNVDPTEIVSGNDFDTLVWEFTFDQSTASQTITFDSTISGLQPGESRSVTLETTIDFTNQGTSGQLNLPPQDVFAEQILSLAPASQSVRPGEAANFILSIGNPSANDVTYDLSLSGLSTAWIEIASQVTVTAGESLDVPLMLTSDPFASLSNYGFVVTATVGGVSGSVEGTLTLVGDPVLPDPKPESQGVVVSLTPTSATAGQGTAAMYVARVFNVGSQSDDFVLFVSGLPTEFQSTFAAGIFSVPPGTSNFRDVLLTIVPPEGATADDYAFTVTAASTTDVSITGVTDGSLTVLDLGVAVDVTPESGTPHSTFQMLVTNTGQVSDTFDLSLAAPAALMATLGTTNVTLGPGESQTVTIDVGAIDFAFPGSLLLVGVATSRTSETIRAADSVDVSIVGTLGLNAEFDQPTRVLPQPGPTSLLLLVDNVGNLEDQYSATIMRTNGPITASLSGLDGQPTQTVPVFILPGLSRGAILLNTTLTDFGQGEITVQINSLTDESIVREATATLMAEGETMISIAIASAASDKAEGNAGTTPFTFTVTRSGDVSGATTVNFAVTGSGENLANAADFGGALPSGQVMFAAGETTQMITVNVSGDTTVEPDESFLVTLSGASGGATITTDAANGVIRNDDAATVPMADLSLVVTVDNGSVLIGRPVTLSVLVNNVGPDAASGVTVSAALPSGLGFVSAAPAAGEYDRETGIWTIGGIAVGTTANLQLVANRTVSGAAEFTASVATSEQLDRDSTPGNNDPTEDDQFSIQLGQCLTGGPFVVGMNRLTYSCVTPGSFVGFVIGTGPGGHHFDLHGVTVDIANPSVPAIGVGNINGVATVLVDLPASRLSGPMYFQAFEMVPNRHVSELVSGSSGATTVGTPLVAETLGTGAAMPSIDALTDVIATAIARWHDAGATPAQLQSLRSLDIQMSDLPGDQLASTSGEFILLDNDAAGHGWFIGATTPDATKIDALTVLLHEMGHVLGLDDVPSAADRGELMSRRLSPGTRRSPNPLPAPQFDPRDVNHDNKVSALDALVIINQINVELGPRSIASVGESARRVILAHPDHDANGDGRVSASDALEIINHLSRVNGARLPQVRDEQTSSVSLAATAPSHFGTIDDELLSTLADDLIQASLF